MAIKYDIVYSGTDTSSAQVPPRTEVSVEAGNARFDMGSGYRLRQIWKLSHVEFRYLDTEGEHKHANVYMAVGSVTMGQRLVQYRLEHPIGP